MQSFINCNASRENGIDNVENVGVLDVLLVSWQSSSFIARSRSCCRPGTVEEVFIKLKEPRVYLVVVRSFPVQVLIVQRNIGSLNVEYDNVFLDAAIAQKGRNLIEEPEVVAPLVRGHPQEVVLGLAVSAGRSQDGQGVVDQKHHHLGLLVLQQLVLHQPPDHTPRLSISVRLFANGVVVRDADQVQDGQSHELRPHGLTNAFVRAHKLDVGEVEILEVGNDGAGLFVVGRHGTKEVLVLGFVLKLQACGSVCDLGDPDRAENVRHSNGGWGVEGAHISKDLPPVDLKASRKSQGEVSAVDVGHNVCSASGAFADINSNTAHPYTGQPALEEILLPVDAVDGEVESLQQLQPLVFIDATTPVHGAALLMNIKETWRHKEKDQHFLSWCCPPREQ